MNPPANWYPDPTGRHGQRYWDGEQWTEHVFTDGVQGVDPLEAAVTEQEASAEEASDEEAPAAGQAASDDADRGASGGAGTATAVGSLTDETSGTEDTEGTESTESTESTEATWTPQDQSHAPHGGDESQSDAVAPEVEAEDVVGTLDEVAAGERPEGDASDLTTAAVVGAEEAATGEEDLPPDFSDAFMVTPETVSRLVSRRATTEPASADPRMPDPAAQSEHGEEGQEGQEGSEEAQEATGQDTEHASAEAPEEASDEAYDEASDQAREEATEEATTATSDAPAPTVPGTRDATATRAPAAGPGLGISGDLVGGAFAEREQAGPVALQNSRLLRCSVGEGPGVVARQGTMVAYQGDVDFERQGAGGVTRALKRAATGEGLAMMRVEGTGDVFFADGAQHVFLLHLEGGPGLSVNGRNVLAFSAALQWDIERVKGATLLAGGLFNTSLTGNGWVALVSDGEPVVLRTEEAPTYVDVNALVAWSGGLGTRITNTVTAKSLVGLGSGEAFQMAFEGSGIVIVQPSEGPMGGAATT